MHGGPVLQPKIACLMWSPPGATGFSTADVNLMNQYPIGVQQYLVNQNYSGPPATEPALRQYGVWGASFPANCIVDHGHIPKNPIPWANHGANPTIQAEIAAAQAAPLNLAPYSPETVILVFTKGIPYASPYGTANPCAYHSAFGSMHNYYGTGQNFGIIPYPTSGCTNGNALNEFQTLASHELFEAATDPVGTSWFDSAKLQDGEIGDGCAGALLTFPSGGNGYVSQVVDDFSGACESFAPEEMLGASAVKTGTNTVNVIIASGQLNITQLTGDGTNWNYASRVTFPGETAKHPAVVSPDGTSIDVYVRGLDGALWNQHFDGTNWWGWISFENYFLGPPAVGYRATTGLEYVFMLMMDGTIGGFYVDPVSWSVSTFTVPLPAGVLATSPPQVFPVTNTSSNSCFYVFVNGSDNSEYVQQICSDPSFLGFSRQRTGIAPTLVSSFESSTSIIDMIVNPLAGNREGVWGGSQPEEYFWQNGVLTWSQFSQIFRGPLSAVKLGASGALAVGRQLGQPTAWLPLIASTSPNMQSWSAWTQIVSNNASGSPYMFSPDGQNADVFFSTSGALKHIRFNGSSWQAQQDLGLQVQ
jgi:hypothetical protein